jgi:ATP/maltotriose-dependent transcriptional regulator MalT
VSGERPGPLGEAEAALDRHDWAAAHALATGWSGDDPAAEAERLDVVAEAAWWLGRLEECVEARSEAYRRFEDLGDTRRAGQCAIWLYEHHCMRVRPAIATAWLQRARRMLEDDPGCVEHVALLLREGEVAHGESRLDDASDLTERAHRVARELGSTDLEAEALQALGRILIDEGEAERGLAHLDEAMLLAVEGRLGPYSTGKVYCSLISACEDLGDLRRAAEWTEATAQWAERHPFAIFPGICRVHRAFVLNQRGAMTDAEREATRACDELLASHLPNAAAAFAEVGDIRRRLGNLDRAEEAFARAEELSGAACTGTAILRLAQGRIDAATRIISGCLAGQPAGRQARAWVLAAATQIAIAADDVDAAQGHAEELAVLAATFDNPVLRATEALARGRVQLARQDPVTAGATLHDALQLWQELEIPYEEATTRTVLAKARRDAGDEAGARESFAAARALFDQIGVRLDGTEATGRPALPGGLTEREAEVLRLVASGLANKEIAAELHLSAKTVSRHLTNIFTKIGVSSRAAATAYAFEHGVTGER